MPAPRLVAAGVTLREQINKRWPNRDKASDGWIGDTAHQARPSDHNPDRDGWVHALDIDKDGIDAERLANELIAYCRARRPGSERIKNIVFRGRVASGTYADRFWVWRFDSDLGHESHIHISFTDAAERDGSAFPLPVFGRRTRIVVPMTGVYAEPSWRSRKVTTRYFGNPIDYVAIVRDEAGRRWLKTPNGNYVLAARTAVGR